MRRTDAQQGFSSAAADADVIVVGCGLAGLSAALAAAQRRARVVLFDSSSDLFATNDVTDRLYFNAVDPERQGDLGITDSPELFYRQTLAAGGGRAAPALVKILCYQAYIALKWLEGFGVGFENKVRQIPGGVYPRTCVASDYRAGRLAMMNAALDAGVTVLQGLTFRELVLDAQGRVTGVAAEDADGRRRILRAPATVARHGGFASDAALCARHDRRLGALFDMRGGRASGLGLRAAVKAGAYLVGTDYFSLTMGTAGRAGFAVCPFHPLRFILVDASGGRVVNEQDREAVVEALLDAPGQRAVACGLLLGRRTAARGSPRPDRGAACRRNGKARDGLGRHGGHGGRPVASLDRRRRENVRRRARRPSGQELARAHR